METDGARWVDTRASIRVNNLDISLDVMNLFNRAYSTTGFLDPGGSGSALLFPAAGQVFEVGVRLGR